MGDSGSVSLNTSFVVSCMEWYMMSTLVGSWGDGIGRSVTISADLSSDDDWHLMSFIAVLTSSRTGWSTSLSVWFSTRGNGGY